MKLPMLMLFLSLAAACQGQKNGNKASAPANIPTDTTTTTTPTPTEPTDTTEVVTEPETEVPANQPWKLNAENCAALGQSYVEGAEDCAEIRTKEACEALGNGSIFKTRFLSGECIGPRLQENEINCAAEGKKYDQASDDCRKIKTQAACEALANGSIFSLNKGECIGPLYLPSAENCAAFGGGYDATKGSCTLITTQEECTALNSDAKLMLGGSRGNAQQICAGRCMYRGLELDQCYVIYGQKEFYDALGRLLD